MYSRNLEVPSKSDNASTSQVLHASGAKNGDHVKNNNDTITIIITTDWNYLRIFQWCITVNNTSFETCIDGYSTSIGSFLADREKKSGSLTSVTAFIVM